MTRIWRVFCAFIVVLLMSSPIFLIPGRAWAACCNPTCKMTCTCRGTYPCAFLPDDSDSRSNPATIDAPGQTDTARDTPALNVTTSALTDSFLQLTTSAKCFRDKLALGVLGNARAGLKFVTFSDYID
jgi:hypothetical protein